MNDDIDCIADDITKKYKKFNYLSLDVLLNIMDDYHIGYDTFHFRENNFSGMLCLVNNKYHIVTNLKHRPKRKMFTIAHELSHYFLHLHIMKEFICTDILKENNRIIETEANKLAAVMLMPADIYIEKYKFFRGDFKRIANNFYLSEECVRWRYVNLFSDILNKPKQELINEYIIPYKKGLNYGEV